MNEDQKIEQEKEIRILYLEEKYSGIFKLMMFIISIFHF